MEHTAPAGTVRVANEVIASIAAMAARDIDGVAGLDEANARHFGDFLKRETAHRGVRVVVDPERKIHLELFLTSGADVVLRDVAEKERGVSTARMLEECSHPGKERWRRYPDATDSTDVESIDCPQRQAGCGPSKLIP